MRRIALRVLFHDRLRALLSLLGVAAATALVLLQLGLEEGFRHSASDLVHFFGGDVWLVARGTVALEDGEVLPESTKSGALATGCVTRARSVLVDYGQVRREDQRLVTVAFVAGEAKNSFPKNLYEGRAPKDGETVVDAADRETLGVSSPAKPGKSGALELRSGASLLVSGATRDMSNPARTPYLFTAPSTARRVLGLGDESAHYLALDTTSKECLDRLASAGMNVEVLSKDVFARRVEDHWIHETGLGQLLSFGVVLSLLVASAVLAQTLSAHVRAYRRELAALRAAGALHRQLYAFVAWQAATLVLVGALLGALGAYAVSSFATLPIRPTVRGVMTALGLLVLSCSFASLLAMRLVRRIRVEEVLT